MQNIINAIIVGAGEPLQIACGHHIACPPHLGRGQARQRRLAEVVKGTCRSCVVGRLNRTAQALTLADGTPRNLTAAERMDWIVRQRAYKVARPPISQ